MIDLPAADLFDKLSSYDPVWSLVAGLKDQPLQTQQLDRLGRAMGVDGETLAMALTRATSRSGETLAPLRVHSFHRAFSGLWCCTNPACPDSMGGEWTAGRLLFERDEECPKCRMPVAELYACNECGEAFMIADEKGARLAPPRNLPPSDEFLFEADRSTSDDDEESDDDQLDLDTPSISHCFSLSGRGLMPIFVDTATGMTADGDGEGRYRLSAHAGGGKGPARPAAQQRSLETSSIPSGLEPRSRSAMPRLCFSKRCLGQRDWYSLPCLRRLPTFRPVAAS